MIARINIATASNRSSNNAASAAATATAVSGSTSTNTASSSTSPSAAVVAAALPSNRNRTLHVSDSFFQSFFTIRGKKIKFEKCLDSNQRGMEWAEEHINKYWFVFAQKKENSEKAFRLSTGAEEPTNADISQFLSDAKQV